LGSGFKSGLKLSLGSGLGALALACLPSCGDRANDRVHLAPEDPFDRFAVDFDVNGSCAGDGDAATGCGRVSLSGDAAGGGFASSDIRVRCAPSADGYLVRMADGARASDSGIEIVVSYAGERVAPRVARVCRGPEREDLPPPEVRLKESYCTVQVRVQGDAFTSSPASPCTVRVAGSSPLRGTLSCAALRLGTGTLTVENETSFTCPKDPP
jgi:hypothetical protein